MAKVVASSFSHLSTHFTMHLFSTTTSATAALSKPSSLTSRRFILPMSQAILQPLTPTAHFGVRHAGYSSYSPLNSGSLSSSFSDQPPTEMAPLFPNCDKNHWLIVMDKPDGEGATKQQMIDAYVQTLAKIFGSEEEAKKKIYITLEMHKESNLEMHNEQSTLEMLIQFSQPQGYDFIADTIFSTSGIYYTI